MTHEKLLARINNLPEIIGLAEFKVRHDALRAVVELHKPHKDLPQICDDCVGMMPCETLQAIEKVLND